MKMNRLSLAALMIATLFLMSACFAVSESDESNWNKCGYYNNSNTCSVESCCQECECSGSDCCCDQGSCCESGTGTVCDDVQVAFDAGSEPDAGFKDTDTGGGEPAGDAGAGDSGTAETTSDCIPAEGLPMKSNDPCVFDIQCGADRTCVNGLCLVVCTHDSQCPSLQECNGEFCFTDFDKTDTECLFDTDCGDGGFCLSGYCTLGCELSSDCAEHEMCKAGICRPDTAMVVMCEDYCDCADGQTCVMGVCMTACETDEQCSGGESCYSNGVCGFASGVLHECDEQQDCPCNYDCINGFCEPGAEN